MSIMNLSLFRLLIIILFFGSVTQALEKTPIFIGFWEKEGVRKVFEYREGQWHSSLLKINSFDELKKAASQYTSPSEWTLFFDGKTYGNISTQPFTTYSSYKENGLQKIISKEPQLAFRKVTKEFSDWNGENIRPILVCNSNDLSDPDQWKPGSIKKNDPSILNDLKRRLKGKIYYCKNENCEGDSSTRDLKDTEISVAKAYRNAKGDELHAMILKFSPKAYAYCEIEGDNCNGEGPFWYLAKSSGEILFLTKAAALIDAVDLNHDGNSELLFWLNEYNSNGYEIIDGKSHAKQSATWSYH
jgi:hypothetical protein